MHVVRAAFSVSFVMKWNVIWDTIFLYIKMIKIFCGVYEFALEGRCDIFFFRCRHRLCHCMENCFVEKFLYLVLNENILIWYNNVMIILNIQSQRLFYDNVTKY